MEVRNIQRFSMKQAAPGPVHQASHAQRKKQAANEPLKETPNSYSIERSESDVSVDDETPHSISIGDSAQPTPKNEVSVDIDQIDGEDRESQERLGFYDYEGPLPGTQEDVFEEAMEAFTS